MFNTLLLLRSKQVKHSMRIQFALLQLLIRTKRNTPKMLSVNVIPKIYCCLDVIVINTKGHLNTQEAYNQKGGY